MQCDDDLAAVLPPARFLRVYLDRLPKTVSQVMADGPIHLPLSGRLMNPHCFSARPPGELRYCFNSL